MDTERLAAYLDGELDTDEAAAIEAALAGDPRLRAELAAMRRADEALGSQPATELPPGFEARLRRRLDAELVDLLGTGAGDAVRGAGAPGPPPGDELAARRVRRTPSWVPAFAGAAAAVAVIAGTVVGIGVLGSGGDDATTDSALTMEAFDGDEDTAADDAGGPPLPGPGEAPTVVLADRDLDEQGADELLSALELQAVVDRRFDEEQGRGVGLGWREALAGFVSPSLADAPELESNEAETLDTEDDALADAPVDDVARSDAATGGIRLLADGPIDEDGLLAADRCLTEVLAADGDAIPVYLELVSYEGEPAVLVGLVTLDPATGAYTRPEVWILDREACQVRRFAQG